MQGYATYYHGALSNFPNLQIAAYTGSRPNNGTYFSNYSTALTDIVNCRSGYECLSSNPSFPRSLPTYWAIHDYLDPTAASLGIADLAFFGQSVADIIPAGSVAHVWVTESGVHLDEGARSDLNLSSVSCTGESDDANTFGCLVDGNASAQAVGGITWETLSGVDGFAGDGASFDTPEVLWYQFRLQSGKHDWDSALVDGSSGAGLLRPSYCAITNLSQSWCTGNDRDYLMTNGI